MTTNKSRLRQLAFYCDERPWPLVQQTPAKETLLFFDGIAVNVPDEELDRNLEDDPVLSLPLHEKELLVNVSSELQGVTLNEVTASIQWPKLRDDYEAPPPSPGPIDVARVAENGGALLLLMLAGGYLGTGHYLSRKLATRGEALHPLLLPGTGTHEVLANFFQAVAALPDMYEPQTVDLGTPQWPADLREVGADLTNVPLDEVLDFRQRHMKEYRQYAADLRQFGKDLLLATPADRLAIERERMEQLRDEASQLRSVSRSLVRKAAVLTLSLTAAAWSLHDNDPAGAALEGAVALADAVWPDGEQRTGAYSYVLGIKGMSEGR